MAKKGKKIWAIAVFLLFVLYFFSAARPIPPETVLVPRWLSSLETDNQVLTGEVGEDGQRSFSDRLLPFTLGDRFGYVDSEGSFPVNQVKQGQINISENLWTEYEAEPANIEIKNNDGEVVLTIEDPRGYPVLLDNRIFILGSEQNTLSEVNLAGNILWTHEFAAPLTCIDAAAGLVLAGSIDGVIEVLDHSGKRIFSFDPGGSRYAVILGCTLSRDGMRIGIISGVENQRFLLLERYGTSSEYRVVYHEFLETGFRRPVHISFIDQDRWIVFEREGGIGCYEIKSRQGLRIALDGKIAAIDQSGGHGFFFLIYSQPEQRKELIGIRLPEGRSCSRLNMQEAIVIRAPFKSNNVFLGRTDSGLLAGGGTTLISFDLENK